MNETSGGSRANASTIRFNPDVLIGSLGESLRFGQDDEENQDDSFHDELNDIAHMRPEENVSETIKVGILFKYRLTDVMRC